MGKLVVVYTLIGYVADPKEQIQFHIKGLNILEACTLGEWAFAILNGQ